MKPLILAVFAVFLTTIALAQFDLAPYQSSGDDLNALSEDFFYPQYFRETDRITLSNLIAEIRFRFEFFAGISPESKHSSCFIMQKRINRAVEKMRTEQSELPFKRIDDDLIFNELSPLYEYLKPMPRKVTLRCGFKSVGDLDNDGVVYCTFHGPSFDTEFYTRHRHRFDSARPLINSFEIVEMLIFFPALLILPITWYVMKKALEK